VIRKPCKGKFGNCPNLVKIGEKYCSECASKEKKRERAKSREYDQQRGTPTQRGYGAYWQKVRARKLKNNPLCENCLGKDIPRIEPAVLVHHIDRNPKNNISSNLMSLCNRCHEELHKNDRWGKRVR